MIETMLKVAGVILLVVVAAYQITKHFTKDNTAFQEDTPTYSQEELENIKVVEELYNKELRSAVDTQVKNTKPAKKKKHNTPKKTK